MSASAEQKWGSFISANGLNTSRFLDPPEFQTFQDKGNEENLFDRVDFKASNIDTLQLVPFLAVLVPPPGVPCNLGVIDPGWRNELHAGLQQAIGKDFVLDGEYIWKYTHNGYDFGIVGATPIAFPIE